MRSRSHPPSTRTVALATVEQVYRAVCTAASPPTVPEIARAARVSEPTVRRALVELEAARRVRVFYGPPAEGRTTLRGKTHYRYIATGI